MIVYGDLCLLERDGASALERPACEIVYSNRRTIEAAVSAATLALMEERRITSLIGTEANIAALRVVHLHNLRSLELI
jgi:hypothetical protein